MRPSRAASFLNDHPEINRVIGMIPKRGVQAIFLFGSHATGTSRPLSDVDLCIITGPELSREETEELQAHASRTIHISLYRDLPPAVRFRVLRDGLLLWGTANLALHRIKTEAIRSYRNVQPLIHRHVARILR